MSDFSAIQLEARSLPAQMVSSSLREARSFVTGLLFTAAIAAVGTFLFTLALVIGVVGSPVIAAVLAFVLVRSRRAARIREWRPAVS